MDYPPHSVLPATFQTHLFRSLEAPHEVSGHNQTPDQRTSPHEVLFNQPSNGAKL
jgi:hypothetical protein